MVIIINVCFRYLPVFHVVAIAIVVLVYVWYSALCCARAEGRALLIDRLARARVI